MSMNPYFDPDQPHHRRDGFQNNYTEFVPKSLADVLRWRWGAARSGLPAAPRTPIPSVAADLPFLHRNARPVRTPTV
jgi:N-acyl-phosphatidylethanolamine-hydrolysing phospholipase D